jgi:hypothetical protein
MMLTNMRTVVVIEHVQHDQDEETTNIIFEEDIHDDTPMNLNPRDCPNDHSGSNRAKYFVEDYCKNYPDDQGIKDFIQKTC